MIAFHGIGAYRGQRNPLALRAMLNGVEGAAICGADRPIRAFGAVVCAPFAVAFPYDVWSEADERTHVLSSLSGNESQSHLVEWYGLNEDAELVHSTSEFMAYRNKAQQKLDFYGSHHYCELWLQPVQVRALWVKDWADAKTKRAAKILAKHRGLPLLTVDGTTRIWDLRITEYAESVKNQPFKNLKE